MAQTRRIPILLPSESREGSERDTEQMRITWGAQLLACLHLHGTHHIPQEEHSKPLFAADQIELRFIIYTNRAIGSLASSGPRDPLRHT